MKKIKYDYLFPIRSLKRVVSFCEKIIAILLIILLAGFVGFICGDFFGRRQKQEATVSNQDFTFSGNFLNRQFTHERVQDTFRNKKILYYKTLIVLILNLMLSI